MSCAFVDYCEADSAYAIGLIRARRKGLRITDREGNDLTDEQIADCMREDMYSVQVHDGGSDV